MRLILTILCLWSVTSYAQPGYTQINNRYNWLAGEFRALNIPGRGANDSTLATGQSTRSGAILADTVNNVIYWRSSGRWWAVGGTSIDTTQYVRYTDTASMLLPYLRKIDTTAMLTPYVRRTELTDTSVSIRSYVNTRETAVRSDIIKNGILRGNGTTVTGTGLSYQYQIANDSIKPRDWVNVRDFGAVGDNATNDRAAFQAAAATGKNIYVPPGTYYLNGASLGQPQFTLSAGQALFGAGYSSRLRINGNNRTVTIDSACVVSNLAFEGGGKAQGNAFQTGVFITGAVPFEVSNCWFYNFSGAAQQNGGGGITGAQIASNNSDGGRINNCYFYNNNGGLNMMQRAEYVTITNNNFGLNTVAVGIGGGNLIVNANIIQNNTTGVLVYNGTNFAHSTVSNNLINHNTYPIDISDVTYSLGMVFSANQIFYGSIRIRNSVNIRFQNDVWQFLDSIHITNSSFLQRVNCWIGTTNLNNPIPVRLYTGAIDFQKIGEYRMNAAKVTRWIDQQGYRDTTAISGPTYIDNRIDINGAFKVPITTLTTTTSLDATHHTVLVDASGGAVTINLPAAAVCAGRIYRIKKIDSSGNTVTIDGNSSETIDGATTQTISSQWGGYTIQSNGTNWFII